VELTKRVKLKTFRYDKFEAKRKEREREIGRGG